MERLPPGAANPNAFSGMVTRLCKTDNDANPNWQAAGGDIRSGRFEYLPEKVAPCGLHARRNHGTKTGPTTATLSVVLVVSTSPSAACSRPWLASFANLLFGKLMSSFLNGRSSVTSVLLRDKTVHLFHARCKNYSTVVLLASMLASTSRSIVRSGILPLSWVITFEPFVVPPDCSNLHSNAWRNSMPPIHSCTEIIFRTLVGIYTAAYEQDNYAIIDKVSKRFTEQIAMSIDLSFVLFCESIVGCQIAIGIMTLRPDLRIIIDSDVLRKFIRGLTVVGHKSPTGCDSIDAEYVKLYCR